MLACNSPCHTASSDTLAAQFNSYSFATTRLCLDAFSVLYQVNELVVKSYL